MKNILKSIFNTLHERYGYRNWWPLVRSGKSVYLPEFRTRDRTGAEVFEIMVGALLTQNTNWSNAVLAIRNLKEKKWMSPKALSTLPAGKIAAAVKPSGYYRQKAKKLKALSGFILGELRGKVMVLKKRTVDEARSMLLSVWGVGPETADSILLYGYGKTVFVVDAYTRRIFSRLGHFKAGSDYESVRKLFESGLKRDKELFMEYHALIVELGKFVCRTKPLCLDCVLNGMCGYARK